MNKKISIHQFFILMTIVPYGSASLFFLASKAKQDAWVGILAYSLVGMLLQVLYLAMYKKHPGDTLIEYLPKVYGKFIGSILGILYMTYFTYIAARVFRDYSEVISAFPLPHTPKAVFGSIFVIVVIYALYNGVENLASMAQLFFIVMLATKLFSIILILATEGAFKPYNLMPVLSNGLFSVLKKSWQLMLFPYGETIVFTMLYPYVIQNDKIKKAALLSIVTEAALLASNNILFICTLGLNFATLSNFPLLETYRLIRIGDFLSRLEVLFLLIFLIEGFFKICIFLYAAILGTSQMFKLKDTKSLCVPFGIVVLMASLLMARNYPRHIKIGLDFVVKYVHIPMQIVIPVLTLLVYYIKRFFSRFSRA